MSQNTTQNPTQTPLSAQKQTGRAVGLSSTAVPSQTWRMLANMGQRPELPKGLDAVLMATVARVQPLLPRRSAMLRRAGRVIAIWERYRTMSEARLREEAQDLRALFRRGRETRHDTDRAFALLREVSHRTLGLLPHKVQIAAALVMDAGHMTELATGEGKTLSATVPATIAGWRGRGCHVITVNDYLAQRDATNMASLYHFCGLSVAHVDGQMNPLDRRRAYAADVTYCTNKEVAADFLRDRLALGQIANLPSALLAQMADPFRSPTERLVLRGLHCAIVDEADSVLMDEAVTPLIISGDGDNPEQVEAFATAADIAGRLDEGVHFHLDHRYREVNITVAGRERVRALAPDDGIWAGTRRREELVNQALCARHFYLMGKQYVIQEGKIVIVDDFTGRLMPDRTWRDGLHQAVEAKEKVTINPPKVTLARISFQRFFRMYKKLGGMTGTAWEGRRELWQIYKMPVVRVPTHRRCIRVQQPDHVYRDTDSKWRGVVEEIERVHLTGRPVLVGTRSVGASEALSAKLTALGLEHQVLNAVRHAEEAQIIAGAGQPGRITVATNMAGRGTDIKLGGGVAERGGLHVISTERHESGRIDRQLFGRAGRQGDPGSAVAFCCLDDELLKRHAPKFLVRSLAGMADDTGRLPPRFANPLVRFAQNRAEAQALRQRKAVLKTDDWLEEFLGFAGREG